ncbi:hypothetical protein [Riemerella anatipestifer]|uniref:hypothetical protein n=1 Tax=Riemerella anatipestifer TaxID=34085 RepID=UPI00069B4EF8|nr:hypothetical protein [Riemerella anatipestifer]
MKTKTTKLSVLAFLGLGLAVYGQSGKVGINISSPRATLDVQPNATNSQDDAKTNEGILAPKLSKIRVASIEAPVEGTLVYVIDDATKVKGTINDYTGSDPKVAKITEKGYYYYNGTEWVKSAAGSLDQEWVYDATTNRISLKRSGVAPFNNAVFYDNTTGQYYNTDFTTSDNVEYWDGVSNQVITQPFEFTNDTRFTLSAKASKIGSVVKNGNRNKIALFNNLVLDESDTSLPNTTENRIGGSTRVGIFKNYNNNFYHVIGLEGNVSSFANSGRVDYMIGAANNVSVMQGNIYNSGYALANRSEAYWNSMGATNQISAIGLYSTLGANAGNVNTLEGINGRVYAGGTGTINEMSFIRGLTGTYSHFTGTLANLYGFKYEHSQSGTSSKPANMYGIYLGNVNAATDKNYAIYTNVGKVHFGDEVNVAGTLTATSIKGSNGATIFPDYVFQKYYTGTSSLKADYNFKTLSQVEDFVKTNGHLPGYKSAAEIKKQGYIDLMATQLTNVEKIEELYLHLLEKDKEVKELKARLEKLEALLAK